MNRKQRETEEYNLRNGKQDKLPYTPEDFHRDTKTPLKQCSHGLFSHHDCSDDKEAGKAVKDFFGETIYSYTSEQATEDGILFDVDAILNKKYFPAGHIAIKYITTGLLEKGYWNDRCKHAVALSAAGENPMCGSCDVWINHVGEKLSCLKPTLNIPNMLDLLHQLLAIFNQHKNPDWFYTGEIELPSGSKQKVFIAQNETERFTAMLPSEY